MGAPDKTQATQPTPDSASTSATSPQVTVQQRPESFKATAKKYLDRGTESVRSFQRGRFKKELPIWTIPVGLLVGSWVLWVVFSFIFSIPSYLPSRPVDPDSLFPDQGYIVPSAMRENHYSDRSIRNPCDNDTRLATLERIHTTAITTTKPIVWITGPAGVGKSAVTQTLVNRWRREELLGATVSFSRTGTTLEEQRFVIGTIAYQLATVFPDIKTTLDRTIHEDPALFARSMATQVERLITKPLGQPSQPRRKMIVLDGVDEIADKSYQKQLLTTLSAAVEPLRQTLRLVVSSRPENQILEILNPHIDEATRINLQYDRNAQLDINTLLQKNLGPSLNGNTLSTISQQSYRRYIYPALVASYMKTGNPEELVPKLSNTKLERNGLPDASIDHIYTQILSSFTPSTLNIVLDILSHWVAPGPVQLYKTGSFMAGYSSLDRYFALNQDKVKKELENLSALIPIDMKPDGDKFNPFRLQPIQRSLLDYIADPIRSEKFHIKQEVAEAKVALSLTKYLLIQEPKLDDFPALVKTLGYHLTQAGPDTELAVELRKLHKKRGGYLTRQTKSIIGRYIHKTSSGTFGTEVKLGIYNTLLWTTHMKILTPLPRLVFSPFERMLFL